MSNLLVLYEIAERASKVRNLRSLRQYESWISNILKHYHDAAIEQVARIHLFRLKEQYHLA